MMVLVLINDVTGNIGFIGKTTCDGPDNFGGVNSATSGCGDNGTGGDNGAGGDNGRHKITLNQ